MADISQKRTLSGWIPADASSEAEWRKQKLGEVYRGKFAKPRNYKHHCLFMCLLEKTFENQDAYTSDKLFRRAIALEAGHTEQLITVHGEVIDLPLPYDYDHIPDEDDFTKAFGAAMTVCAAILRMAAPELEEEVSRYATEQYHVECPAIFRRQQQERAA